MPLTPGTTLGPYTVTAKIGGMGVYWAKDTTLDRQGVSQDDGFPSASRQRTTRRRSVRAGEGLAQPPGRGRGGPSS